jgi:hypothetical protein
VAQRVVSAAVLGHQKRSISDLTGPSAHSTASVSSNSASERVVNGPVELPPEPGQLPERRPTGLIMQTTHRSPYVDLLLGQKKINQGLHQ